MGEMDRQYLETPFYGSRWMKAWLERHGAAGHLSASPQQPTSASGEHQCSPCPASTRSSTSCTSLGLLSHWSESWTTAPPDT